MRHRKMKGIARPRLAVWARLSTPALPLALGPGVAVAAEGAALFGIPAEFILFALTLIERSREPAALPR